MMQFGRSLAACLSLLTASGSGQAKQQCESVLQVGAWNIQWLGNPEEGKRTAQTAADVASYIKAGGVDVLAVSEVSATSKSGGWGRNKTLDEAFALLNKDGTKWHYRLAENRKGARNADDQWAGVAWNESKVQLVGEPVKLEAAIDVQAEEKLKQFFEPVTDETVIWSRWPHAYKFSAGVGLSDFVMVPVHMKSNSRSTTPQGKGPFEASAARARAWEAELVVAGLRALPPAMQDKDLIILGDTNMKSTNEPAGQTFAAFGLKDCNARDLVSHIGFGKPKPGDEAPFDRIYLAKGQPEVADSCSLSSNGSKPLDFKLVRPGEWQPGMKPLEFRKQLSDHMMVRTGICIMKDDD